MTEGYNFAQLREEILERSDADIWEVARKEWSVIDIWESDEPESCLCGHYPIIEMCEIHNRITKEQVIVGNVCVKRFLGFRADLIFESIKRIKKDTTRSLNADAIAFFYSVKLLTNWEYGFLQDTIRKRKLSLAQLNKRSQINRKVLSAVRRRGFQGPD